VCCDESLDLEGPFCFFYAVVFKKVLLCLPLSVFEKELLTELNVAPAHLHPNSWAFVHAFTILCSQLAFRQLWVSSGTPTVISRLFKNWFLRVWGASVPVDTGRASIGLGDRLPESKNISIHAINDSNDSYNNT